MDRILSRNRPDNGPLPPIRANCFGVFGRNVRADYGFDLGRVVAFSVDADCQLNLAWQTTAGTRQGVSLAANITGGFVFYGDGPGIRSLPSTRQPERTSGRAVPRSAATSMGRRWSSTDGFTWAPETTNSTHSGCSVIP